MKKLMTTALVASVVAVAGWAGLAYAQQNGGMAEDMPMMQGMEGMQDMSDQMMGRCRMTMGAPLSPHDPAVLLGMKDQLELSDQQVQQLQTLAQETRQKAAAVLNDAQRKKLDKLPQQPQSMMQMHQQMMGRMQEDGEGHMQGMGNMDMCAMMMRMMMGGMGMHGGQSGMMGPATQPAEQVELDAEAQTQVDRLVSSYLTIQQRLAEDQMQGVAAQLAQVRQSAQALSEAGKAQLEAKAQAVAEAAQAQPKNLEQARAAFKELSAAVIGLMQIAVPSDQAASALYVANCPMAGASWLQATKQVTNPYMGQRMLRCGSIKQTIKAPSDETPE